MSKHTPGPWMVVRELRGNEEAVADLCNETWVIQEAGRPLGEFLADANLIAAAPDLLAFAQFVLLGLETGRVKCGPILDFDGASEQEVPMTTLHAMARKVIAKSAGEPA